MPNNTLLTRLEELLKKATSGDWTLCHHLKSAENDTDCPCGARGTIWGGDGESVICEMGVGITPGEEGLSPTRYPRSQELANATLFVALHNAAPALIAIARAALDAKDCLACVCDSCEALRSALAEVEVNDGK